jgi:hypothetical protein
MKETTQGRSCPTDGYSDLRQLDKILDQEFQTSLEELKELVRQMLQIDPEKSYNMWGFAKPLLSGDVPLARKSISLMICQFLMESFRKLIELKLL